MPEDGKVVPLYGSKLNASLKEALKEQAENRLKVQYNVGKKPETKKIQSLQKGS